MGVSVIKAGVKNIVLATELGDTCGVAVTVGVGVDVCVLVGVGVRVPVTVGVTGLVWVIDGVGVLEGQILILIFPF